MRRSFREGMLCATLALCLLMTMVQGVGKTIAYLADGTHQVVNLFQVAQVPPVITEEFDGILKTNVRITNDGNVPAYIRAVVAVTWQDEQGNLAAEAPQEGVDYSVTFGAAGWQSRDGYRYCLSAIEPGKQTSVLIASARQLREKKGYSLVLEILAQTVQAEGTDSFGNRPVELAWGVDIEDGTLKDATITGKEA